MSTVSDWTPSDADAPPPESAPPPPDDLGRYRAQRAHSAQLDVGMDGAPERHGERVPPQDMHAEQSALGGMLLSRMAIADVTEVVQGVDFYRPAHELIFDAIVHLYARGEPADTITVADELTKRDVLRRAGGQAYLHDLIQAVPTAANAGYYATIVAERAVMRRMVEAGTRIVQLGYGQGEGDIVELVDRAEAEIGAIRTSTAYAGVPGVDRPIDGVPVEDFLAQDEDDEPDWLIPGFLERRDRIIVTAAEGVGKSTLLRQWAVQVAAGVHPFTVKEVEPKRVLLLDLENSERQIRRKLRPFVHQVARILTPGHLVIACKADGLDLSEHADRTWLDRLIDHHQPDIVIGGPLYKLTGGNPNDEVDVKPAALYLDTLRARHDVALALEAHSRKGENSQSKNRPKEPFGWSGWMRWPEFGIHLDKDGKISHWRGMREVDREIPENLHRGGIWPWMPVFENSRLGLFIRVEECCEDAGEILSQREIARRTGLSEPMVRRVIGEHQARWDRLPDRIGGAS